MSSYHNHSRLYRNVLQVQQRQESILSYVHAAETMHTGSQRGDRCHLCNDPQVVITNMVISAVYSCNTNCQFVDSSLKAYTITEFLTNYLCKMHNTIDNDFVIQRAMFKSLIDRPMPKVVHRTHSENCNSMSMFMHYVNFRILINHG